MARRGLRTTRLAARRLGGEVDGYGTHGQGARSWSASPGDWPGTGARTGRRVGHRNVRFGGGSQRFCGLPVARILNVGIVWASPGQPVDRLCMAGPAHSRGAPAARGLPGLWTASDLICPPRRAVEGCGKSSAIPRAEGVADRPRRLALWTSAAGEANRADGNASMGRARTWRAGGTGA